MGSQETEINQIKTEKPRVIFEHLDEAAQLRIRPCSLITYAKDVLVELKDEWIITFPLLIICIAFIFADHIAMVGEDMGVQSIINLPEGLTTQIKALTVGSLFMIAWLFFSLLYSKKYGRLGLRVTDEDSDGNRQFILFRKNPNNPIIKGHYLGKETDLKVRLYKKPSGGEFKVGIVHIYDLSPLDQTTVGEFLSEHPFPS